MTEKRLIAGQAVGMLLALGVGILIGARACAPELSEPEPETPEPEVIERVVYRCLPDAGRAGATTRDAGPPAAPDRPERPERPEQNDDAHNALPDAPEPQTPAERRQLLSWVRERSVDLQSCGGANPQTIRTTVTLELKDDGTVGRVFLVDTANEIDSTTERCLRMKMSQWVPPADLVQDRERLIFGLTL